MPKNRRSLNRDRREGTFITNHRSRASTVVGKLSVEVEGRLIYCIMSRAETFEPAADERVDARGLNELGT